ncbi:CPBP family intramembrane glutamic endopeptidase [Enterococcus sp. HY326]|uniref:CPBP family intramembrane glutamic endopeptidase n=1 Tax=Enterococcus sp. HY326 TaxID=2971265 RepID=UPI00223F1A0F|nr:CPBP family intramembrane glutamic endopeptidase [Enterococcus sp. HY326]
MAKNRNAVALILVTIAVAVSYLLLHLTGLSTSTLTILGSGWNAVLAGLAGYFLLKKLFTNQFKHFSIKTSLWGAPLTLVVGLGFGLIYTTLFGRITQNSIESTFQPLILLTQVPLMIMGEEIISTNILLALKKIGLSFTVASILVSILFAFWHVTVYGLHPLQLLFTLAPVRFLLNYLWHKSDSIWVSWLCHYLYDAVTLLLPLLGR